MDTSTQKRVWSIDQLTKSEFFHQKAHEWGLLETANAIESLRGEEWVWRLGDLNISEAAWNKVIHRGIKPIIVFAHPFVLQTIPRATSYYRMLAMVSQKSMSRVHLSTKRFEEIAFPDAALAQALARHLNTIISILVEADEAINVREFDLWRGMAAGSQAQGSWQNTKGARAETVVQGMVRKRLQERHLGGVAPADERHITLPDGRFIAFADEPDIGFYSGDLPLAAVEIKGGIDTAAVLERIGAAVKSLRRIKDLHPAAVTLIIVQEASLTPQAERDLRANQEIVNHWMTMEEIVVAHERREAFFSLLQI
ncbi:MAG: XcyI family restriction endonuclease [Caldilineales bacterium]|nr:XcyI family restriction endonuclease [Caldilineales bacterium]